MHDSMSDEGRELEQLLARYGLTSRSPNGPLGRGWFPIVEELIGHLLLLGWDRDLRQVKEKFGSLRFYIGETTPEMRRRIEDAQVQARETQM